MSQMDLPTRTSSRVIGGMQIVGDRSRWLAGILTFGTSDVLSGHR